MEFDKRDIPVHEAKIITQVIQAALAIADDQPVMFSLVDDFADSPTPEQAALSKAMIVKFLSNFVSSHYETEMIGEVLGFMEFEFDCLYDCMTDDKQANYEYIQMMYGIVWDDYTKAVINKYYKLFTRKPDATTFPVGKNLLKLSTDDLRLIRDTLTGDITEASYLLTRMYINQLAAEINMVLENCDAGATLVSDI